MSVQRLESVWKHKVRGSAMRMIQPINNQSQINHRGVLSSQPETKAEERRGGGGGGGSGQGAAEVTTEEVYF